MIEGEGAKGSEGSRDNKGLNVSSTSQSPLATDPLSHHPRELLNSLKISTSNRSPLHPTNPSFHSNIKFCKAAAAVPTCSTLLTHVSSIRSPCSWSPRSKKLCIRLPWLSLPGPSKIFHWLGFCLRGLNFLSDWLGLVIKSWWRRRIGVRI